MERRSYSRITKWMMFASHSLFLALLSGSPKANGVLLEYFVKELDTSHTMVATAFAIQVGLAFLMAPVTDTLMKSFSARQVSTTGGFLVAASYMYCGLRVESPWQLMLTFVVSGAGLGLQCLPSSMLLEEIFQSDFPMVVSISQVFIFVGVGILPQLMQSLVNEYGHSYGIFLYGTFLLHHLVCGVTLREINTNQTEGNEIVDSSNANVRQDTVSTMRGMITDYITMVKNHGSYVAFVVAEFVANYCFTSWTIFLVSLGTTIGLSENEAVFLASAGGVGGCFGKVAMFLLFRYRKATVYNSNLLMFLINGISLISSMFVVDRYLLAGLAFVEGFCIGLNISALTGYLPSIVCHYHYHLALVVSYVGAGLGGQLAGTISGIITDISGSVRYVFGFNGLVCLMTLPVLLQWALNDHRTEVCNQDD